MIQLIQLSENDKRILVAICIVFILLLVLVGYIVVIVSKIMKRQGKQVDTMMYDVVKYRVVKDSKHFKRVAHKKTFRYFYKKTWIPILLMLLATTIVFIFCVVKKSSASFLFSADNGFGTLFYLFDWKNTPKAKFFGLTLPCDWPPILITASGRKCTPQFLYNNIYAWISYVSVPLFFVGAFWYLFQVQGLIAREIRIIKMSKDVYSKNLDELANDNTI